MSTQDKIDFERIRKAIGYIVENGKEHIDLEQIASAVNLSPFHFQRMFTEWAGVSPKKFQQYISLQNAKRILKENQSTLFDTAYEVGLSGTGRLHDLFVTIEGMTPAEYRNGGESLNINYSNAESPFGKILIASTTKGICYMAFADDEDAALSDLRKLFPKANYNQYTDKIQQNALFVFTQDWKDLNKVKLHLKGTDFQLKVWETLLKVPEKHLTTYGQIANRIGTPKASRAVGSAVGNNPVAYLIPCHRVILSTGIIGQYHWGSDRKAAILGWENSQTER